jgi:Mg-chelatase subunit ChlD
MKTVLLLLVVLILATATTAVAAEGVFTLFVFDCSGSMNQQLKTVASAQASQVKLAARPRDFVSRILFSESVRKDLLAEIRTSTDLDNAVTVLSLPPAPSSEWTFISHGLAQAYDLWRAQAAGRQTLMFLVTDALPSTPTEKLHAEMQALKTEAARWRAVPRCRILLVAIDRGNNAGAVRRLSDQLGATVVTPKELASTNLIVREVQKARHQIPVKEMPRPVRRNNTLSLVAIVAGLLFGCLAVAKICLRPQREHQLKEAIEGEQDILPWRGTLTTVVTMEGEPEVTQLALPNDDCPDGRVTFGPAGCAIRLPDALFDVILSSAGAVLDLNGGRPVIVDGITLNGGSAAIGDSTEIIAGNAHVIVSLKKEDNCNGK